MRWEKVQVNPFEGHGGGGGEQGGPGKRWGHTCNAIRGGRLLYVFGGYGKDNCQTNQVHVFDTVKQTWSQPAIKGSPPTPRDSHTCTAISDNLFVFGGTDGMNPLKDLHILDTSTHTWISPSVRGDGPEAREGHSAAVVGKRLFIFGGSGKSADNNNEVYYNDVYILNTETFVWKCATTSGTPPSPRDSHTCSSWKNKIVVIGGEDGHDYYLSDVHILDTDTLIWRELGTSGQLLPPRAGHSTVCFGKNLFVFGGFTDAQNLYNDLYMLDIDTGIWNNVATTTNGPSARFSVAGDCLDPFKGGVLVFIGGCNKSLEALDDMYFLYTGIAKESEQRPEKLSLRKQLKLKCQEQNTNPVQNQVLGRYGMGANISPIMEWFHNSEPRINIPVTSANCTGRIMFECKVTETISDGYTIETVIDGKLLRGVLFSNKPKSLPPAVNTSIRKRIGEVDVVSNGIHPNKSPKVTNPEEMENRQAVHGDSSESHEHLVQVVPAFPASNPATTDASGTDKVSANPEPNAAVSMNQSDNGKDEAPKSLGENLKNDGANDVTSSKDEFHTAGLVDVPISSFEAPKHDMNSNAPNCNTEFLKPAPAETPVCLSNQGVTADCAAPLTEESSEPAKLT